MTCIGDDGILCIDGSCTTLLTNLSFSCSICSRFFAEIKMTSSPANFSAAAFSPAVGLITNQDKIGIGFFHHDFCSRYILCGFGIYIKDK
jgi:hypothetical protein